MVDLMGKEAGPQVRAASESKGGAAQRRSTVELILAAFVLGSKCSLSHLINQDLNYINPAVTIHFSILILALYAFDP